MIVVHVLDPELRRAVCDASHPEEDCLTSGQLAEAAFQRGWVRLVVRDGGQGGGGIPGGIPVLDLDADLLRRWEDERRKRHPPFARAPFLTARLKALMTRSPTEGTWVDSALADLARAAGSPLPFPLRAFARRVMEFPSHYADLRMMAGVCGLSRGALKARFRRQGLESPFTYLRWFRVLAVAHTLSDPTMTVARAAHRLGYSSDGNLCRAVMGVTGMRPSEIRSAVGWNQLLIGLVWSHLTPAALEGWEELDALFARAA